MYLGYPILNTSGAFQLTEYQVKLASARCICIGKNEHLTETAVRMNASSNEQHRYCKQSKCFIGINSLLMATQ